jgi:hypothetical protein
MQEPASQPDPLTLLLFSDGLAVMPLVIVAVVVASVASARLIPAAGQRVGWSRRPRHAPSPPGRPDALTWSPAFGSRGRRDVGPCRAPPYRA